MWTLAVTFGFSFVFWGVQTGSVQRSFEISGSSLFTLGFAEPEGIGRIWLTFVEATIGLGLVALLISYLPTIYSAHHERDKGIGVLRPFAGTPPSPVELWPRSTGSVRSTIPTYGGAQPIGCWTSIRPIAPFPPSATFPSHVPISPGWPRSAPSLTVPQFFFLSSISPPSAPAAATRRVR